MIIVGYNHTFGKDRSGSPALLKEFASKYNYECVVVPEQKYQDKLCNREEVRKALKKVTETGWIEPIKIQSQNRNGEYIPGAYITKYRATR